jgi:hypothetical protein
LEEGDKRCDQVLNSLKRTTTYDKDKKDKKDKKNFKKRGRRNRK